MVKIQPRPPDKPKQIFKARCEIGQPDLHQMQRVQSNAGEVTQNVHIPAMKESLLFLAMKSKHAQQKNNHEFNMSLLNAIQSL